MLGIISATTSHIRGTFARFCLQTYFGTSKSTKIMGGAHMMVFRLMLDLQFGIRTRELSCSSSCGRWCLAREQVGNIAARRTNRQKTRLMLAGYTLKGKCVTKMLSFPHGRSSPFSTISGKIYLFLHKERRRHFKGSDEPSFANATTQISTEFSQQMRNTSCDVIPAFSKNSFLLSS